MPDNTDNTEAKAETAYLENRIRLLLTQIGNRKKARLGVYMLGTATIKTLKLICLVLGLIVGYNENAMSNAPLMNYPDSAEIIAKDPASLYWVLFMQLMIMSYFYKAGAELLLKFSGPIKENLNKRTKDNKVPYIVFMITGFFTFAIFATLIVLFGYGDVALLYIVGIAMFDWVIIIRDANSRNMTEEITAIKVNLDSLLLTPDKIQEIEETGVYSDVATGIRVDIRNGEETKGW